MKHKTLLCLVLILTVIASVFSSAVFIRAATDKPVLSIVLAGTTSTTQLPAVAVGSTFSVDVRVDNIGSITQGINGLSYTLSWDPTVLALSSQGSKGSFWGSTVDDVTAIVSAIPGSITESSIIVNVVNPRESTTSPGVARTLTFRVLAVGQSSLSLSPSDVGIPYLTRPDGSGGSIDVDTTTVGAIYGSSQISTPTPTPTPTQSPTPTPGPSANYAPQAKINLNNGTQYQLGDQITLNGLPSEAGFDSQTCPITNWAWLVQYQNNTIFSAYSGQLITFPASVSAYFNVTLIVTAPSVNPNPSLSYQNTSYASVWIYVQPAPVPRIDLFTNKGGVGIGTNSDAFGPQELVQLYAYVTFNTGFVANKFVTFTVISPNGTAIIPGQVATTNASGYAAMSYRTPWVDNNNFGNWRITATVEVSQMLATDSLNFTYNYLITPDGIILPAIAHRLETITINATIRSIENTPLWQTATITVYDDANVPIGSYIAARTNQTTVPTYVSARFTIPQSAFVGTATVYISVLTDSPTSSGVPYCPERVATFQLLP